MKSYFNSILIISLVGKIISSLLPERSSGLKKYVNYIIGLVCTIVLLSPISGILGNISSLQSNINSFFDETISQNAINQTNSLIIDSGIKSVEDGIKSLLVDKYSLAENEINVKATINDENITSIKITSIEITLTKASTWQDSQKIKDYLEGIIGCEIKIIKI